jgi:hypothetical protein
MAAANTLSAASLAACRFSKAADPMQRLEG